MLIGRDAELSTLLRAREDACEGRGSLHIISGPAGVGKTALVADIARQSAASIRLTGDSYDRQIPYGGLRSLVEDRPAEVLADLDSLRRATGLIPPDPDSPPTVFQVAADVLTLLSTLTPPDDALVLVVDDAHWLDALSWSALHLSLSRMHDDRVLALVVVRERLEGASARFEIPADLPMLRLAALPDAQAHRLLTDVAGVTDQEASALVARWGGNPLLLLQAAASDTPMPASVAAEEGGPFLRQVAAADRSVRMCLLLAILEPRAKISVVRSALSLLIDQSVPIEGSEAVERALSQGLLVGTEGRLALSHPLVSDAVLLMTSDADRRAAHRALAEADVFDDRDVVRDPTWHVAAALDDDDPALQGLLNSLADAAELCGDRAVASRLLVRAASIAREPAQKSILLLRAGQSAVVAGLAEGPDLLHRIVAEETDPDVRDPAVVQLAMRAAWNGDLPQLLDVVERCARPSPEVELLLDTLVSMVAFIAWDQETYDRFVGRVGHGVAAVPVGGGPLPHIQFAASQLMRGRAPDVERAVAASDAFLLHPDHDLATPVVQNLIWYDQWDVASAVLEKMLRSARSAAALPAVAWLQVNAAEILLHSGRLDMARIAATEAGTLGRSLAMPLAWTQADCMLAQIEATAGNEVVCREVLARCTAEVREHNFLASLNYLGVAQARLALGSGRYAEAQAQLQELMQRIHAFGFSAHHIFPALPELIAVLVRGGKRAEALGALAELQGDVPDECLPSLSAWLAYARLAVSLPDDVELAHASAVTTARGSGDVMLRARVDLLYGQLLRRARRRTDAVPPLNVALNSFRAVGAVCWARQVESELRAAGVNAGPTHDGLETTTASLRELTVQEQQIARLAATGLPTRQIASSLFLSPKTVEAHLTRIYRKMDVASKAQLAHVLR